MDVDAIAPPLTTRSVLLSVLLGSTPPVFSAQELIAIGRYFHLNESTTRVVLSRMVSSGDLTTQDSIYTLSKQHLDRQQETEARIAPQQRKHDGSWWMVIVTETGRSASDRATTRNILAAHRFAELREGVWMRPQNIELEEFDLPSEHVRMTAYPDNELELAHRLWDIGSWATTARQVLELLDHEEDTALRLRVATAAVRLLRSDPVLPQEFLPFDWPGPSLSTAYANYRRELAERFQPNAIHAT